MTKRNSGRLGWVIPTTERTNYIIIDVHSSDQGSSPVDFEFSAHDKSGDMFHNGKLNFRSSDKWSVALSTFNIPNNFETFPSIDDIHNQSAAFHSMQVDVHYTYKEEDFFHTVKLPPTFFPHKSFTPEEILSKLNEQIHDNFLSVCNTDTNNKNKVGNTFKESVGHMYIDTISDYIYFKSFSEHEPEDHPFRKDFFELLKDNVLPHPKKEISNFIIRSLYIWVGNALTTFLGEFNFGSLWNHFKLSGITFHGEVIDTLIFSYQFADKSGKRPYLVSKHSVIRNKQGAIHVRSNITVNYEEDFAELAVIPIPFKDISQNVNFTPARLLWRPICSTVIEKIRFKLTDGKGNLLNFSHGKVFLTLIFRPSHLISF